jgi:hypothetical protein
MAFVCILSWLNSWEGDICRMVLPWIFAMLKGFLPNDPVQPPLVTFRIQRRDSLRSVCNGIVRQKFGDAQVRFSPPSEIKISPVR